MNYTIYMHTTSGFGPNHTINGKYRCNEAKNIVLLKTPSVEYFLNTKTKMFNKNTLT